MLRVEITWIDSGSAAANDQWTKTADILKNRHIGYVTTVGMLLELNSERAIVGLSYDEDNDNWFSVQVIERSAISRITVLRARKEYAPDMFDTLPETMV